MVGVISTPNGVEFDLQANEVGKLSDATYMNETTRRKFIKGAGLAAAGLALAGHGAFAASKRDYKIAVDGWTFHREVFSGKIKQVDLFKVVRDDYGIEAFNLVNNMLEVPTADYTNKLKSAAKKSEVVIPLIMVDSEGALGHAKTEERDKAIRNHTKWIWMASDLGCHSVRVNWGGAEANVQKSPEKSKELIERSADAFGKLAEIGKQNGINVIIENHWGPSSYPDLMVGLMKAVNLPNFGTLPDFGNFPDDVDRYDAVDRMMPYAKAVSAKCHEFGADGNETKTDFEKMMQICVDKHGYHGYMGIEFEGDKISEREGLKACQNLLVKLRG